MAINKFIIRFGLFLLGLGCFGFSAAQDAALKEAEVAYTKEDYKAAIELYEGLLKNQGESAAVYYNLGNAYYKAGQIAPAILNYERALLLQPGDKDIRFNLQLAKARTVDKIEPAGQFFLTKWFEGARDMASADAWGATGIVSFLLFLLALVVFLFSKVIRFKKVGFYVALVMLVGVVLSNVFGFSQKHALTSHAEAIIFAPTVTVRSSPDQSGNDLVVLHEGTKVAVRSTLGEWSEVELPDGNVGWMPSKDLEVI